MKTPPKLDDLGKADLHIHSNYSDGHPSIDKILEYVENKTILDIISITDHDTIKGSLEAVKIAKKRKYRFEVVVGEEISTKEGHILGLFLNEAVPSGLGAHETILRIKKQGGIAIASHPLQHIRFRGKNTVLMDGIGFVSLIKEKDHLDGVEVINGTPTLAKVNRGAQFLNDTIIFKAETGSSDAHILHVIGKTYTLFEGKTAKELKEALLNAQTRAMSEKFALSVYLRYFYFFLPKGLRLGFNTLVHGRLGKRPKLINYPD